MPIDDRRPQLPETHAFRHYSPEINAIPATIPLPLTPRTAREIEPERLAAKAKAS